MTMRLALLAAATAVFAVGVKAQPLPSPDAPSPDVAALVQSCSAHKFETVVQFTKDGNRRQSKVKLCGTVGQTDAQWAGTLRDAANKIMLNEDMPMEGRQQVAAALKAELARLDAASASGTGVASLKLPRETLKIASLPPPVAPVSSSRDYTALPPLPAPITAASSTAAASAGAVARPLPPRLTIRCLSPSDFGAVGSCATMEKDTLLAVRADESLPAGLRLRFLRKGDERGEVTLAAMRQGETLRVRPPARLCTGVVRSSAQIQIVKGGDQVLNTLGPYELRCS